MLHTIGFGLICTAFYAMEILVGRLFPDHFPFEGVGRYRTIVVSNVAAILFIIGIALLAM